MWTPEALTYLKHLYHDLHFPIKDTHGFDFT